MRRDIAGEQVARHDTARMAIHDHDVKHLFEGMHLHALERHLTLQRRIRAEQQLLTSLATCVERARHLCAAERAVCEEATVLAGKRDALRHTLVDNVHRQLREPVDVRLTGAEVATLDRVVEQSADGITVVLIILRGVDTALRSNRMRAARRVVVHETGHVVAKL